LRTEYCQRSGGLSNEDQAPRDLPAERAGWTVAKVYKDHGISGANSLSSLCELRPFR
jgi:hypothetical protein